MIGSDSTASTPARPSLDLLDRLAVLYLVLPVVLFLLGWFRWWVALPIVAGMALAGRSLLAPLPAIPRYALSQMQVGLAAAFACVWVYFSGMGHFVFANADWYTRDAVLHDLVAAHWPVGYHLQEGADLLLRAPLGFYMPAAIVGKALGLPSAHYVLTLWAAMGAALFLLQVMSLAPSGLRHGLVVGLIVVFFSGMDFVGSALNWGPRFFTTYDIAAHIEWWAGRYQYSSMTTQFFWVPNHALGAWVLVGLLMRASAAGALDRLVPVLVASSTVWSPLSALGILPFIAVRLFQDGWRARLGSYLRPTALLPALLLVAVVGLYFTMDTGRIDKGLVVGDQADGDVLSPLLSQFQFFLFEAGFLGMAILAIRKSADVMVALAVLLLLPLAQLGPANDLVMRGSIPSLAVLLFACCAALFAPDTEHRLARRKRILAALLALGSITAVHEFARAILIKSWPANMRSSIIAVNCGAPPHYVAHILNQPVLTLMRPVETMPVPAEGRQLCLNPAWELIILREQKRSRRNT